MLNVLIVISILVWVMASIMSAATFGAMCIPNKINIIKRSIVSSILLIPCLVIVPLGFVAGMLILIIIFIIGISMYGINITRELIIDGIPEMDEDGNLITEDEAPRTPPWI
tara:strand:- start:548 stop:880 length:333 start_codon:yes stop_codon:yes gene_type:complete